MAANPLPSKPDTITVTGQAVPITDDLWLYYLPVEGYDFVVTGPNSYLVKFDNPSVFGTAFAVLKPGNNVLVPLTSGETQAWVYSGDVVDKLISGNNVETTPIVIPPRPRPKHLEIVPRHT